MEGVTPGVELAAIASGAAGAVLGALGRTLTGNRRVDKVEAVDAVSGAYRGIVAGLEKQIDASDRRNTAQIDRLESHVEELRREIVRKDEMLERLITKLADATGVIAAAATPVAVVATVPRQVRHTDGNESGA